MRWGRGHSLRLIFLIWFLIQLSKIANANPCDEDFRKFCTGVQPTEAGKCLNRNANKISSDCEKYALYIREKRKSIKIACYGDIKTKCEKISPGDGRVFSCLKMRAKQISSTCKDQMSEFSGFYGQ